MRATSLAASLALSGVVAAACGTLEATEVPIADAGPPDPGTDAAGSADGADDAAGAIPPPRRPPEGDYVYAASGSDQIKGFISFPAAPYGPTVTVTVAYVGTDCFEQTFTLRSGYSELMRFCIRGLELVEDSEHRYQSFAVGSTARTSETCVPGDVYFSTAPTLGPWAHDCSGNNTDSQSSASAFKTAGSYIYVGDETLTVMGQPVVTKHFYDARTVTGSQTGSNTSDWYFSAADGVLQRFSRNITIDYPSNVGPVKYVESVEMTLASTPGASDAGTDAGSD
jgi:hypothetical protein